MLWDRTMHLPRDLLKQVEDVYRQNFPLEVRVHLRAWIEQHCSPSEAFVSTDPEHQRHAANLAQQLLAQLDALVEAMPNDPDKYITKSSLSEIAGNLRQTYASKPADLYCRVRYCLEQEMQIGQQGPEGGGGGENDIITQIREQLALQKQRLQKNGGDLERCRQQTEAIVVEFHACRDKKMQFKAFESANGAEHPDVKKHRSSEKAMEKAIEPKYLSLICQRQDLVNTLLDIYQSVKVIQEQVLDKELVNWKREQQLAGNGHTITVSLDILQEWCEGLADIIWTMRTQVNKLEGLRQMVPNLQDPSSVLPELMGGINQLLSLLLTQTFVIDKQPPQVMKTNTRFGAAVRLLVGGGLNIHMAAPTVTVSIVSESQANRLAQIDKSKDNSGTILNGNGTMEFNSTKKQVFASFKNLQLKKIKRTEKKGTESVMDEKFCVVFWTEFQVAELKFLVFSTSLPVVVIVHGNQESQALATVTWDNAFAELGRQLFIVPDKVSWAQAGAALSMKWAAACGSPLTEDNLYYLACKALRNNNLPKNPEEYNSHMLSWNLFCKENLPERNFTFWEWFYRILLLTSNHLRRLWKEGYVMGFVTRQAAESLLLQRQMGGLFLLRFSDSELGGVTIAYTKLDMYQALTVCMVAPFTTKDLSQRSMADVIFDLNDLAVLYPETPKETFKQFCSATKPGQSVPSANGYVKHMLVTHVEGASSMDNSNPATPMGYDMVGSVSSPPQGEARSPVNFVTDEMDLTGNLPPDICFEEILKSLP